MMVEISRRTALAFTAGVIAPAPSVAGAEVTQPISPVAAVLRQHPWINQPTRIETTALAGKLAEYLGWPPTTARAIVRAAYEQMIAAGPLTTNADFLADVDRRIADAASSDEPLPRDRFDTPEHEERFARMIAEDERRLVGDACADRAV